MTGARTVAIARRRDARLSALRRRARLSPAAHAEFVRLQRASDAAWRALPRRIERARDSLAHLLAYADEIGLGPC